LGALGELSRQCVFGIKRLAASGTEIANHWGYPLTEGGRKTLPVSSVLYAQHLGRMQGRAFGDPLKLQSTGNAAGQHDHILERLPPALK
jgi:hypothetical protein